TLQSMTAEALEYTLTQGLMSAQGSALTPDQRSVLIDYLAATRAGTEWISSNQCSEERAGINLEKVSMPWAGVDLRSSRNMSAAVAGLDKAALGNLELAWAIAFPNITGLRSAPVVTADTLFYPAASSGYVLAIDAHSGCIKWSYDAGAALRSSATLTEPQSDGRRYLVVSDEQARLHALDPLTGELIWQRSGEVDPDVA